MLKLKNNIFRIKQFKQINPFKNAFYTNKSVKTFCKKNPDICIVDNPYTFEVITDNNIFFIL